MIPCKECITLAACRNKKEIDCPLLSDWYNENKTKESDSATTVASNIILSMLPNIKTLGVTRSANGQYISRLMFVDTSPIRKAKEQIDQMRRQLGIYND